MSESKDRDAFFTKDDIAQRFIDKVDSLYPLNEFDDIIEPSAGSGRILHKLPFGSRGFDIHPMSDDIIEADFLKLNAYAYGNHTLAIGNPPFGRQSKLAIQFFNKCAEFADVIAFIIPRSWMKYRTQNQLNKNFELYSSIVLPDKAFTLDGKDYAVRCCAQIWAKEPPKQGVGGYESWNDRVSQEMLDNIDAYQLKYNCYEKPKTLF